MIPVEILTKGNEILPLEKEDKKILYVVTKKGFYLRKRNSLFIAQVPVDRCPFLQELNPEIILFLSKKIPPETYMPIFNFMFKIYRENKTESMAYLFYNEKEGTYEFNVPFQEVTCGSVKFLGELSNKNGFRKIGSIHSHGSMAIGPSHVDVNDEKEFDGIHIIAEKLDLMPEKIRLVANVVVNGVRAKINPMDLFDGLEETEEKICSYNGKFLYETKKSNKIFKLPNIDVEPEVGWFDRVKIIKNKDTKIKRKYDLPKHFGKSFINLNDHESKPLFSEPDPCATCPFRKNVQKYEFDYNDYFDKTYDTKRDIIDAIFEEDEEDINHIKDEFWF